MKNYDLSQKLEVDVKPGDFTQLTEKERIEDVELLYTMLKNNYPYFHIKQKLTGYHWLKHKEDFVFWAKTAKTKEEFYRAIKKMLILLQNDHTEVLNPMYRKYLGELYSGDNAWGRVLNNEHVKKKYEIWKQLEFPNPYILPGVFYYVEGCYVYSCKELNDKQKINKLESGDRLLKIDGVLIDEYINTLLGEKNLSYDFKRKKLKLSKLSIFTVKGKKHLLTFEKLNKEEVTLCFQGIKYIPNKANDGISNSNVETKMFNKQDAAYLRVRSFAQRFVEQDKEILLDFFKLNKDKNNLIIDIRGNRGGNEEYYINNMVAPLIEKTLTYNHYLVFRKGNYIKPFLVDRGFKSYLDKEELMFTEELPCHLKTRRELREGFGFFLKHNKTVSPKNNSGFKGKIFLIVDNNVFSAAESFASFCKHTGFATVVGSTTGGDGLCIDPCVYALKNSGLVVRFSMNMGLDHTGEVNEEVHTAPEIYVETCLKDFLQNRDTVLNYILKAST